MAVPVLIAFVTIFLVLQCPAPLQDLLNLVNVQVLSPALYYVLNVV